VESILEQSELAIREENGSTSWKWLHKHDTLHGNINKER
jgi:hypothetical protein